MTPIEVNMIQPPYDENWKNNTILRLQALGYAGFTCGPGENWWPIDRRGRRVAGPFTSTDAFDDWLSEQEARSI
jgi:hypothetical protein